MAESSPRVEDGIVESSSKGSLGVETETVGGDALELGGTCKDSILAQHITSHIIRCILSEYGASSICPPLSESHFPTPYDGEPTWKCRGAVKEEAVGEELWKPTEFTPVPVEAINDQSQHDIDTMMLSFLSNCNAGATTSDQKLEKELCVHAAGLRRVEG